MRRGVAIALATALVGAAAAGAWLAVGGRGEATQLAQGRALYAEHCAACHGADLEGQPDWKRRLPTGRLPAPPHDETGHTWHHSDRQLIAITKYGPSAIVPGYESDMPGFAEVLSDAEIEATLAFIKSTWPEREREFQEQRTRADPG